MADDGEGIFKPKIAIVCPKCGWEWNYKGFSKLERVPKLVTCPGCGKKVPIESE